MRNGGQVHYRVDAMQRPGPIGLGDVADFANFHVRRCV
jgi:hypothetical protein